MNLLILNFPQVLGPASTRVYSDTPISRIYSVYAIVMLPGQTVPLHLDVPEFYGIERSACPNWLLVIKLIKNLLKPMFQVAAHCSGLFSSVRVRNVTSVCYPATRHAGALAVYHPKQACRQKPKASMSWVGENVTGNLPNKGQYDLKWSSTVCSNGYQGVINYNLTEFVEELLTW